MLEKLPNSMNFRICNDQLCEINVVHHDRFKVVRENPLFDEGVDIQSPFHREESEDGEESSLVASSSDESDYSPTESDMNSEADTDEDRRYPIHHII